MGRIGLAFRMFFRILFHGDFAVRAGELIDGAIAPAGPTLAPVALRVEMKAAAQSEALTLLSVLQREGRLIDFLKEPIGAYDDVQIGAAVRDVHRDCSAAIDRVFGLRAHLERSGRGVDQRAGRFRCRTDSIDRQCGRATAVHGAAATSRVGGDAGAVAGVERDGEGGECGGAGGGGDWVRGLRGADFGFR